MRPLFYHYAEDQIAWETADCYLFGRDLLVAPVLEAGVNTVRTYLPKGDCWIEHATGRRFEGGQFVTASAPMDTIPIFIREGAKVEGVNC